MTAQRNDDDLDVEFERVDEPGAALPIRAARPNLVVDFEREHETARRYAEKSLAESTRIAYAADFAAWSAWCAARGYPAPRTRWRPTCPNCTSGRRRAG